MILPHPNDLFDRLAARLPPLAPRGLAIGAGTGIAAATGLIAFHHPWVAGPLLLAGLVTDGLGQAMARGAGVNMMAAMPLALLLVPFGFALADPSRALAAMFLMLSLCLFTAQRALTGHFGIHWLLWLAGMGLAIACALPDHFSLLAYLIGIVCFMSIGHGLVRA